MPFASPNFFAHVNSFFRPVCCTGFDRLAVNHSSTRLARLAPVFAASVYGEVLKPYPRRLHRATCESRSTPCPRLANHGGAFSTDSHSAACRGCRLRFLVAESPLSWHSGIPLGSRIPITPTAHLSDPMDRLSGHSSLLLHCFRFLYSCSPFLYRRNHPKLTVSESCRHLPAPINSDRICAWYLVSVFPNVMSRATCMTEASNNRWVKLGGRQDVHGIFFLAAAR